MSKTPFSSKVEILGELWLFYKDRADEYDNWREFFQFADIGLPMAYLAWQEYVSIKTDAKKYVEETWDVLCDMLTVDPEGGYGSLAELFDASPNDPIIDEQGE